MVVLHNSPFPHPIPSTESRKQGLIQLVVYLVYLVKFAVPAKSASRALCRFTDYMPFALHLFRGCCKLGYS